MDAIIRRLTCKLLLTAAGSAFLVSGAHATCGPVSGGEADDIGEFGALANGAGSAVSSLVSSLNTINTSLLGQGTSAFVSAPGSPQPGQQGGGVWVRGVAGTVTTSNTSNVSLADGDADGSTTCTSKVRQNFGGVQLGADISRLNIGGANMHWGLTAGYASLQSSSETFSADFQVPFVGVYGVLTYGGLFADALVRSDFYQASMNDSSNGIFAQRFNAHGLAVAGNVGYNFDLGNSWFIEPSVGMAWSRVSVDQIQLSGTEVLNGAFPFGGSAPGTLDINSIDSLLGRATIRAGTSFQAGSFTLAPFATASIFREFAGDVTSSLRTNECLIPGNGCAVPGGEQAVNIGLTTSRVGTYGQFALGMSSQLAGTGWLGFVRADYRTGSNIEGISGTGGIRYQFAPEPAVAKTAFPVKAPILKAPAVRPFTWAGAYIGPFLGATWGDTNWGYPDGGATTVSFSGLIGGGQIGYNFQLGPWVLGLEGDIGGSNAVGGKSSTCPSGGVNSFFYTCEARMHWLSTVAGRLGYAFDRTLLYAKGGLAFGETDARAVFNPGSGFNPALFNVQPGLAFNSTNTAVGWTMGAGFEFALTQAFSVKAEYKYFDLGSSTYQLNGPVRIGTTGNVGLVGINYHFN
jgi:opacity protein-like surface antigen